MSSLHDETVVKYRLTWPIQPYLDLDTDGSHAVAWVTSNSPGPLGVRRACPRAAHAIEFAKDLIPSQAGTFEHHFFEQAARRTDDDLHDLLPSLMLDDLPVSRETAEVVHAPLVPPMHCNVTTYPSS